MQENPLRPVVTRFPSLKKNAKADIVVVGGGITGVLCGHFLQEAGYTTMILEMDEVGGGASGASSGILYYGTGTNLIPAIKLWGKETARFVWQETADNIRNLALLAERERIDCGLRRPGAIMVARTEKEKMMLEKEQKELAAIGLNHDLLSTKELKQFYPARSFAAGLHFESCAQLYPALFAAGLARACDLLLYEKTKVEGVTAGEGDVVVKIGAATVRAQHVLFATNDFPVTPQHSFGLEHHFSQENSIIFASKVSPSQVKRFFPQEKIFWTMENEYDLFYPHEGRLLLETYTMKEKDKKLAATYPGFPFVVDKQWGSSWGRCADWLPLAGRLNGGRLKPAGSSLIAARLAAPLRQEAMKPGVFTAAATGDQGTISGYTIAKHAAAMVEGRKSRWLELCDPQRFS